MVEIRRVSESDVDALLDLFVDVAAELIYIGTEPGFDRDRYRDQFRRAATSEILPGFVAFEGNDLAGYASLNANDEGFSCGIVLSKHARGRRIGRALMDTLVAWARDHRIDALHLVVFPDNERALRLYRAMGFEQTAYRKGEVKRKTGEVLDSVHMRLQIA
jgi:ribosomal protein S18 acetylase RimI-like enzyme